MEQLLSAIASELVSRAISMVMQRYRRSKAEEAEQKLQQLQRVLLRVGATVEEAEGRFITNQAMLLQLEMLRQGMYEGHYMLDAFRSRAVALRPAKLPLPFPVSSSNTGNMAMGGETVKNFEKMLDRLDSLMSDMREFVVFLEGYPRISRQPYSTYLILDRVMFGRQTETETVINFLLRPAEASGDGKLGVLPIVGVARVGKSTLVEHVCLDERVRRHFSSIAVFTGGGDLCYGNMAALTNSGRIIKHQDHTHGRRRSLAVIELDGDMDHETWRRLYSSATRVMEHGSKIIVTSRSEKVASFGTAQALRLTYLTDEAYWYFFKAIAFGSVNPDDDPRLVSMAMEIAGLNKSSFMGANIVASLMRANLNYKFWSRVLQCVRDFTSKHLLMYGEHPKDLFRRGRPVHMCNMVRTRHAVTICQVFRTASPQNRFPELPTAQDVIQDVIAGRDTDQGDFGMLWWRSTIPPYQTYLARCVSQKIGCSMDNKKRPRQYVI